MVTEENSPLELIMVLEEIVIRDQRILLQLKTIQGSEAIPEEKVLPDQRVQQERNMDLNLTTVHVHFPDKVKEENQVREMDRDTAEDPERKVMVIEIPENEAMFLI